MNLTLEICTVLGHYAASRGKLFTDVLGQRIGSIFKGKMGPIRCPETSVNNYHTTPRNAPEECRCHQHRDGSLKSKVTVY
jgi:hypothetical protein